MTAPLRGSSTKPVIGQVLEMSVGMSWGNVDTVGMTSLKILDANFKPLFDKSNLPFFLMISF
mgnify:CR=1 FL=1